jgi:hypothetical protein
VAQLVISERTAKKIELQHHIAPHEVVEAIECRAGLVYTWDVHPERGERAIVETWIRQRRALAVLYDG